MNIAFIMYVCLLDVCCYQYGITQLLLDGFLWMFTQWGLLLKSVEKVWVCLTLDQNNRHFTRSTTYIYGYFVSNIMVALVTKVTALLWMLQLVPWLPLLLMLPLTFWLPWLSWLLKLPLYLCYHVHWSYQCLFSAVVTWMHLKCYAVQTCPILLDIRKKWRKVLAVIHRSVLS